MNREELRALELNDEQVEAVMTSYGKSINDLRDKVSNVETLEAQIEDYKTQIADRDEQLKTLGESNTDNQELLDQIEALKTENEQATTQLQEKLNQQAFDFSLEKELGKVGVRNPKAVKALLDMENIKFEENKFDGLNDQIEALKASDDYLFQVKQEETETSPAFVTQGNPKGRTNEKLSAFEKATNRVINK